MSIMTLVVHRPISSMYAGNDAAAGMKPRSAEMATLDSTSTVKVAVADRNGVGDAVRHDEQRE